MTIDIDGYFGQALRTKRKALSMTQKGLAKKAKFDSTYISMLERGLRKPSLEAAINLANALNMAPEEIVHEVMLQTKK